MTEVERIVDQLKRAFEGPAWHGPAVMEILRDVTAEEAVSTPIDGAHNIWQLAQHIGAWEGACIRRLNGDRAELSDQEDWAPVLDTGNEAWEQLKATLREGNAQLRVLISNIDEARLDQPILPGMPSVYVTVQGVVQHDLYHAGQIAILKKAVKGVT
jgi:uncharacterized damage-inducible protein DinB